MIPMSGSSYPSHTHYQPSCGSDHSMDTPKSKMSDPVVVVTAIGPAAVVPPEDAKKQYSPAFIPSTPTLYSPVRMRSDLNGMVAPESAPDELPQALYLPMMVSRSVLLTSSFSKTN